MENLPIILVRYILDSVDVPVLSGGLYNFYGSPEAFGVTGNGSVWQVFELRESHGKSLAKCPSEIKPKH